MQVIKILIFSSLCAPVFGQTGAAMMMVSGELSPTYLLDDYPADAAYSLRLLKANHADSSAIRVRRSSDNAELDIGFTAQGYLDTASLKTFVGANDGYVVTWYDQSGSENDATQATATSQPLIINSGTIFRRNSLPAVDFGTTANSYHFVVTTDAFAGSRLDMFTVMAIDNHDGFGSIYFGTTSGSLYWEQGSLNRHYTQGGSSFMSTINADDGVVRLYNDFASASNKSVEINGTAYTVVSGTTAVGTGSISYSIGTYFVGATWDLDGTIQEMIIYTSIQTSNRSAISSNINGHYSIY